MKSKILMILHLPPPVHGAAMVGQYIHDSRLINEQFECRYINLAIAGALEDIGKFSLYKFKAVFSLLRKIRKEVNNFKPDLVYVTPNAKGGAFFKEYIIVQMVKSKRCRVVAHYHNKGVSTKQDQWLYNMFYKRFFKNLKVILLGRSLYYDVERYVKWENVYICPNGIPSDESIKKKRSENVVPRLLFLSNLIESKGVIVLLDALKFLKDRGFSFVCDFVGGETAEIDSKRFYEEVHMRGLSDLAIYKGRKYGNEKDAEIEACDIFILPTMNDCFPLVLLEAMMHGKPVVTTPIGAITDIVENEITGFIVEQNNADQLADKIALLLESEELRIRMGKEGQRKFQSEFTIEKFEKRMCEILGQLV